MAEEEKKKGNNGKALEKLVALIEQVAAKNHNVQVESPKYFEDKVTGKKREHDVVVTVTHHHHKVVIALECRDHAKPVGVGQVEAFSTKCADTGINQGIIVSTSGFANTARTKADHFGIRCLDMEEVAAFDWITAGGFHFIERKLTKHHWTFFPEKESVVDADTMEVLGPDHKPLAMEVFNANAYRAFTDHVPEKDEPVEEKELALKVDGKGLTLRNTKTGNTVAVKYGVVKLTYSINLHIEPIRLLQYREKAENIADAAVTEFKFGDKTITLTMVRKENEGILVFMGGSVAKNK